MCLSIGWWLSSACRGSQTGHIVIEPAKMPCRSCLVSSCQGEQVTWCNVSLLQPLVHGLGFWHNFWPVCATVHGPSCSLIELSECKNRHQTGFMSDLPLSMQPGSQAFSAYLKRGAVCVCESTLPHPCVRSVCLPKSTECVHACAVRLQRELSNFCLRGECDWTEPL